MKNKLIIGLFFTIVTISIFIIVKQNFINVDEKNTGKVEYIQVDLAVNPDDMDSYIGLADYVFIGKIEKYLGNFEANSDFAPISKYSIEVIENLKGELVKKIEVKKRGGYDTNNVLKLLDADTSKDFLPEVNKYYIFIGYGQSDGSLLLAEVKGNTLYNIDSPELKETYKNYIKNQNIYERKRFKTKYDKSING